MVRVNIPLTTLHSAHLPFLVELLRSQIRNFSSFGPLNSRNSHERSENIHLAFSTLSSNPSFHMNQISDMISDTDDIAGFEVKTKSETFDRFFW